MITLFLKCAIIAPTTTYAQSPAPAPTDFDFGILNVPKDQPGPGYVPKAEDFEDTKEWTHVLLNAAEWTVTGYSIIRPMVSLYQIFPKAPVAAVSAEVAEAATSQTWRTRLGPIVAKRGGQAARALIKNPLALVLAALAVQSGHGDQAQQRAKLLREVDKNIDAYMERLWDSYVTDKELMMRARDILNRGATLFQAKLDENKIKIWNFSPEKIYLSRTPHASHTWVTLRKRYLVDTSWIKVEGPTRREDIDYYIEIPADVLIDPKPVEAVASYLAEAYSDQIDAREPVLKRGAGNDSHWTLSEKAMYFARGLIGYYPTPENAAANYAAYISRLEDKRQKKWTKIQLGFKTAKLFNYHFRPISTYYSTGEGIPRISPCEVENIDGLFYRELPKCLKVPAGDFITRLNSDQAAHYNSTVLEKKNKIERYKMVPKATAYGWLSWRAFMDLMALGNKIAGKSKWITAIRWTYKTVAFFGTAAYDYYHFPQMDIVVPIETVNGNPKREDLRVALERCVVELGNGKFEPHAAREKLNEVLAKYHVSWDEMEKGAREFRVQKCLSLASYKSREECERDADNRTISTGVY